MARRKLYCFEEFQNKRNLAKNLDFAFLTLEVKTIVFKCYRLIRNQVFLETQGYLG